MITIRSCFTASWSVTAVLAILLLAACGKTPEPETASPVRPVKIVTVGADTGQVVWEFPGKVAAIRDVELGFEVQGKIIELPIEDGLEANEGDLLARLDPKDYEAARDAAIAHRRAMRSAYNRAKKIFQQGAGSQATVDETERDILVAEQDLLKAQKALDGTMFELFEKGIKVEDASASFHDNFWMGIVTHAIDNGKKEAGLAAIAMMEKKYASNSRAMKYFADMRSKLEAL